MAIVSEQWALLLKNMIHNPPTPLKAGYTVHSYFAAIQVQSQVVAIDITTSLGLHGSWVNARMPLRIALLP
jgi:hypothetical protein